MDLFAVGLKLKAEGSAAAKASVDSLKASIKGVNNESKSLGASSFASFKKMAASAVTAAAAVAAIGFVFKKVIEESANLQREQAQLEAALKSTGQVSGQTIDSLNAYATELRNTTAVTGDQISAAQSLLLTFTRIQGDVFPRATAAILDLATAMGGDAKSAALQVGKALNDPIKGVNALARAGVQFSESQKDLITNLVETNRVAEAQSIILNELQVQFGGSAVAARKTLGGALINLQETWNELFEVSKEGSQGIIDAIEGIAKALPKIRSSVNEWLLSWSVYNAQVTLGIAKLDLKVYELDVSVSKLIHTLTGGLFGAKMLADAVASVSKAEVDIVALEILLLERQKKLSAAGAPAPTSKARTTPGAAPGTPSAEATQEELDAVKAVMDQYYKDAEAAFMFRQERADAEDAAVRAIIEQNVSDTAQIFRDRASDMIDLSEFRRQLRETFAEAVSDSIIDGFTSGIATAVANRNIGDGFKAMTATLLGGLGRAMMAFGVAALKASALMLKIKAALASFNPIVGTAAAVALIALGAALSGAAASAFGGGAGASSVGVGAGGLPTGVGGTGGGTFGATQIVFGATSAGTAAGVQPRNINNIVVIGPDDPTAQRAIQEIIRNGDRRGNIG